MSSRITASLDSTLNVENKQNQPVFSVVINNYEFSLDTLSKMFEVDYIKGTNKVQVYMKKGSEFDDFIIKTCGSMIYWDNVKGKLVWTSDKYVLKVFKKKQNFDNEVEIYKYFEDSDCKFKSYLPKVYSRFQCDNFCAVIREYLHGVVTYPDYNKLCEDMSMFDLRNDVNLKFIRLVTHNNDIKHVNLSKLKLKDKNSKSSNREQKSIDEKLDIILNDLNDLKILIRGRKFH
jgi:hypothetical protein